MKSWDTSLYWNKLICFLSQFFQGNFFIFVFVNTIENPFCFFLRHKMCTLEWKKNFLTLLEWVRLIARRCWLSLHNLQRTLGGLKEYYLLNLSYLMGFIFMVVFLFFINYGMVFTINHTNSRETRLIKRFWHKQILDPVSSAVIRQFFTRAF